MTYKPPYESFRRAQKKKKVYMPIIIGSVALILAAGGIYLIWNWVSGSSMKLSLFSTAIPTATNTATPLPPTATGTETPIPTATIPPTEAPTATASVPFSYIVESGDTLSSIAEKFDVESAYLLQQFNNMGADDYLVVGQELIIPDPNTGLPTETPIPDNLPAGTLIEYIVQPGDYLGLIAEKFLTTEDAILENNELANSYEIYPGDVLIIPIRLITPTFGPSPTPEGTGTATPGS